jgi:tRNA 2-thiouridine synthesizing protein A
MGVPRADGHVVVDSRGTVCPQPIIDLAFIYRHLKPGDMVEIWATDRAVIHDAETWSARTGDEILSAEDRGDRVVVLLRVASKKATFT